MRSIVRAFGNELDSVDQDLQFGDTGERLAVEFGQRDKSQASSLDGFGEFNFLWCIDFLESSSANRCNRLRTTCRR